MHTIRRLAVIMLIASLPLSVEAQVVRGTIRDRANEPVSGAIALLLDSASRVVARQLTNVQGSYRLSVQAPGSYRIQTLRIGYAPMTSGALVLGPGSELVRDLQLSSVVLALDTVRVLGRSTCSAEQSTAETFAIWEQVRTALTAAAITASDRSMYTTTVTRDRTIDPDTDRLLAQSIRARSARISEPWQSLSADSLHRVGYVVNDRSGMATFHAPGLDVLLSDVFLTDHCLRVSFEPTRIAIAIEPTRDRRKIPEIRGTVFIDRASLALQELRFEYTNVPSPQERGGGDLAFTQMKNGAWVITNWRIRMPVLDIRTVGSAVRGAAPRSEMYIREYRERLGELALAIHGTDTVLARPPLTIAGVVRDSVKATAVGGAFVTVQGTTRGAVTDSVGRFVVTGLQPGDYIFEVQSPSLDSVGTSSRTLVYIADSSSVELRIPAAAAVIGNMCPQPPGPNGAILLGTIKARGAGGPSANVTVTAEWGDSLNAKRATVTTEAKGAFRFCSLPRNVPISIRAESPNGTSETELIAIPDDRLLMSIELPLTGPAVRLSSLSGRVLVDSAKRPLEGVEIAFTGLGRTVTTDSAGAFTLRDVPPGEHRLFVRRMGYSQLDTTIKLVAGQVATRTIILTRLPVLDSVHVIAESRYLRTFVEHRERGFGHFLDRKELAKKEGQSFASVLAEMPGAAVAHGKSNYAWLTTRRGGTSLNTLGPLTRGDRNDVNHGAKFACHPVVYLNRTRVYSGRVGEPLFNLRDISPDRIEAVEFYSGMAQVPPMYNSKSDVCGVLVIWLRRTYDDEKP